MKPIDAERDTLSAEAVVSIEERLAEYLRYIAHEDNEATHYARLSTLITYLYSDSRIVRDAAGLGIATMDDPAAIPFLREAIQAETMAGLKRDLELVLRQLVETQQGDDK